MMSRNESSPLVSVVVPRCGDHDFTRDAVRSALRQTIRRLEVIVAVPDSPGEPRPPGLDDLARQDARITLLPVSDGEPRASQLNRCLDIAGGEWVTVLECRDLMHPARLERLLLAGEREAADMVCDNVLVFDEDNADPPAMAVTGAFARTGTRMDVALYLGLLAPVGSSAVGDCFRPLIRLDLLRPGGPRYDTSLNGNADFDLGLRLLVSDARFWWCPELTYFRRRVDRTRVYTPAARGPGTGMAKVPDRDHDAASATLQHDRGWGDRGWPVPRLGFRKRVSVIVRHTKREIAGLTRRSAALLRHAVTGPRVTTSGQRHICIISRQRVIGRTNGSSAYLIGLASALSGRGMLVHLVCPSPATFGRLPAFVLRPEMAVFRSIAIRGSFRIGNLVVAADPRVALQAACAITGRLLQAIGLPAERLTRPAPYAIRLPWRDEEFLYLARHARPFADAILADYAFLTDGIPYVLRPDAPSAVVMHDLISSRTLEHGPLGAATATAPLDAATEMKMLGQADAVVAIQATEAAAVQRHLPGHKVIVTPLAVEPVATAQPGIGSELLFVASKTTSNIDGLGWFMDQVWPDIRKAVPDATLLVAGGVGEMFTSVPAGIRLLGHVPDLKPLYRTAAVVISPLRGGSGLKIKLVEAMAQGKAIVATTTTLQGVEDIVGPAVSVSDDAHAFADAVVALLQDDKSRLRLANAALDIARTRFSAEACNAGFLDFMCRPDAPREPATSQPETVCIDDNAVRRADALLGSGG